MTAHDEIMRLMNHYGFTIDTGDFDGFAGLFEYGEWVVEGGASSVGKAQMLKGLANVRLYGDGTPRTRHVTANVDLRIDEASATAQSQCYVTVFQQTEELPLQAIFCGHYFDDFARLDGVWRFKRRLIRHQLVGDMRAHLVQPTKLIPTL
jgi:hypothetical protein